MRRLLRVLAAVVFAVAMFGCVRETVSCTVLTDDDPLCQDPDTGVIDAFVEDAGVDEAGIEDASMEAADGATADGG